MEVYNVLVVDDNRTCLFLVKAQLERWNYEVTTVESARDAIESLRIRSFDLVLSDVHMPDMNGIELLKQIDREFNVPVILMSADRSQELMCMAMKNGAQYFFQKPIDDDELKNIWQFILWWNANKNKCTSGITQISEGSGGGAEMVDHQNDHDNDVNVPRTNPAGNAVNVGHALTSAPIGTTGGDTTGGSKTKVVWTTKLHSCFVEALLIIGFDRAVPASIVEVMKVPGLTIPQVASHFQKYRKFLQDVLDGKTHIKCKDWVDLDYQSSVVDGNPDLLLLNQLREERRRRELRAGYVNVQALNGSSSGPYRPLPPYTREEAFSSANIASGGLASATLPNTCNETMAYFYQNTLANEQNNYAQNGGFVAGANNAVIPPANNVAPFGTAPSCNNFNPQQSIDVGVVGNSNVYNENNYATDQQLEAEQMINELLKIQMEDGTEYYLDIEFDGREY
ncbi:hypothetical protein POM88_014984 [Heracleum sosnowskyi]|uniref:Response regulatory domain-containing protein n=1 Tax=Heracleum sosnowskyi TaxID=360622 RepID=A0AAD8MVG1_9APIA|nr:hypothetical protein POM88_014984 [Heracleum sosnowskyi]